MLKKAACSLLLLIQLFAPSVLHAQGDSISFASQQIFPVKEQLRWGFIDHTGKVVIAPQYDEVQDFDSYSYVKVRKGDKWGIVDRKGTILLEPIYEEIRDIDSQLLAVRTNIQWGILRADGAWLYTPQYTEMDVLYNNELKEISVKLKKGSKWGMISQEGKLTIPFAYDQLDYVYQDGMSKVRLGTQWGMIDRKGNVIIKPQFDEMEYFHDGMAKVKKSGKWGYVNRSGQLVVPPQYSYAYDFIHGRAIVKVNKQWGVIDQTGKLTMPGKFANLVIFSNGLAKTSIQNKWAVVDPSGKLLTEAIYTDVREFPQGAVSVWNGSKFAYMSFHQGNWKLSRFYDEEMNSEAGAFVRQGGKWGLINPQGLEVIPPSFEQVMPFQQGLAAVKQNGKWGSIDPLGTVVIPYLYDEISFFNQGLATVKAGDRRGLINSRGETILAPQFEEIIQHEQNVLQIKQAGKWGLANKEGHILIQPKYDQVFPLHDGRLVTVSLGDKYGYIDLQDNVIIEPQFDAFSPVLDGSIMTVKKGDKWGLITRNGEVLVEQRYDQPPQFSEGIGMVQMDGKWSFINKQGQPITSTWFEQAESFRHGLAKVNQGGTWGYLNKEGNVVYQQPVLALDKYEFTYEPFHFANRHDPAVWEWLPLLTENADPNWQAVQPRNQQLAQAYESSQGPFDRGFQIDSYYMNPSTLLLQVFQMLGTLETGTSGKPDEFVRSLIHAGYVKEEELNKGAINHLFVSHILYNIFKDSEPYKKTVSVAGIQDPALLWALEKQIPGYEIRNKELFTNPYAGYASEFHPALTYASYMLKFPQKGKKADWYPYRVRGIEQFQDSSNILHRQLRFNGIKYEDVLLSHPELEQDAQFIAAREKAKAQLLAETDIVFQKWLAAERQK